MRDATTSSLSCARETSRLKCRSRRGQYKNRHQIVPGGVSDLLRALPVDIEKDVAAAFQNGHDVSFWRAVGIAEHLCIFKKGIVRHHRVETVLVDEMIVASVHLIRTRKTGRR